MHHNTFSQHSSLPPLLFQFSLLVTYFFLKKSKLIILKGGFEDVDYMLKYPNLMHAYTLKVSSQANMSYNPAERCLNNSTLQIVKSAEEQDASNMT